MTALSEKVIGRLYRAIFHPLVKRMNQKISSRIPKHEVGEKHIKNTVLLANRQELLKKLPSNGTVAELGVDEGVFSRMILDINKPKKLHLIDAWGSSRYNKGKKDLVEQKFAKEIQNSIVTITTGLSTQVAASFPDEYFDWIFIDTDHSYETTRSELELYRKKIKAGGIIAGHDYIISYWDSAVRYGVIEAVNEFCNKYDWEIIYLTIETVTPSFAIRKIT